MPVVGLCAGDLAHGVVEGQAEDLDMEVNGVAGEVALRPAPVAVFDDEAGKGGQNKIARLAGDELETVFLEQLCIRITICESFAFLSKFFARDGFPRPARNERGEGVFRLRLCRAGCIRG